MLNPKRKLFKWGPIDGKFIYPAYWYPALINSSRLFKPGWPANLTYFYQEKFIFIADYKNLYQAGEAVFLKHILPDREFKRNYQKWQKILNNFVFLGDKINFPNLQKLSHQELIEIFRNWNQTYFNFWEIGLLPEIANWGGEQLLNYRLKEKLKNESDFYYALERLSAPEDLSFYQKEELELLVLKEIKNKTILDKKLALHQQNYFWLLNNYHHTQILSKNYFKKILDSYSQKEAKEKIKKINQLLKKAKIDKKEIMRKFKLPKDLSKISQRLSFCIWWQDLRKRYILIANHIIDLFLKEMGLRYGFDFTTLHFYKIEEIENLLVHNRKISKNVLKNRQISFLVYANPKKGELKFYAGQAATKIIAPFIKQTVNKFQRELKGLITSGGKTKGVVKILFSPKGINKMNKGDILVAPMTSPDYILALRKAAAVVTDEGGMTSHAAIVSRELNIPCIVGTKIATRVLKDGDLVEVDATKGIVRIFKD